MRECTTTRHNTLCLPESWICGEYILCQEKSLCTVDTVALPGCSQDQFWCHWNETCISNSSVCDGVNDCAGMEEEVHCEGEFHSNRFLSTGERTNMEL